VIPVSEVSEIARLRVSIAMECEAMSHALSAPAMIGRHAIIARRYAHLDRYTGQLAELVGERRASEAVADIYHRSMEVAQ